MAKLKISSQGPLGPLSVDVLGPRGERVGRRFTMTSQRLDASIDRLEPGEYTIVATRPSGEQLVSTATVGPDGGTGLVAPAGWSPREFLTEAANFGLAYAPNALDTDDFRGTALVSPRAANTAARSMGVLLGKHLKGDGFRMQLSDEDSLLESVMRSVNFRLVGWRFEDGRWRPAQCAIKDMSGDYAQVAVHGDHPVALGFLGPYGFGPIVTVPHFKGGTEITFLAAGVAMDDSADRATNPSALRVPVALAVPRDPGVADLLVGLNASVLANATDILQQGRGDSTAAALDFLMSKYSDPAAAILGGLLLARFAPSRLPLDWLRNLNDHLPQVADSWLLLAWARSVQGDGERQWDMTITEQLRKAASCKCVLFSRTRFQMSKLAMRYGPYPRARLDEVAAPRHARTGDFLDLACEAGGLEAFWGYSPTRPGIDPATLPRRPAGQEISMREGKFVS